MVLWGSRWMKLLATVGSQSRNTTGSRRTVAPTLALLQGLCSIQVPSIEHTEATLTGLLDKDHHARACFLTHSLGSTSGSTKVVLRQSGPSACAHGVASWSRSGPQSLSSSRATGATSTVASNASV